jgi:hypothetical protein
MVWCTEISPDTRHVTLSFQPPAAMALPDKSVLSPFSEPEDDAGVISKIALVIVAASKSVPKSSE